MNDEIPMTNDETNPNDRNDKCPTFNSVNPREVEESRCDAPEVSPRDVATSLDMTLHWCHLSA